MDPVNVAHDLHEYIEDKHAIVSGDGDDMLDMFVNLCGSQYIFAASTYSQLLRAILQHWIGKLFWWNSNSGETRLRVLQCVRLLLRDEALQKLFVEELNAVQQLSTHLQALIEHHFAQPEDRLCVELLVTTITVYKNIASNPAYRDMLLTSQSLQLPRTLVLLLHSDDAMVIQTVLVALRNLSKSNQFAASMSKVDVLTHLLHMLQTYGAEIKVLSIELLSVLVRTDSLRGEMMHLEAIQIFLGMLKSEDVTLLRGLLRVLISMVSIPEGRMEFRELGGIPVLVSVLANEKLVTDGYAVLCACSVMTWLANESESAVMMRANNSIFLLATLLLKRPWGPDNKQNVLEHIFRTMRFLYSVDRNRKLFKRLFPTDLFEPFIDIGSFVMDINAYTPITTALLRLSPSAAEGLATGTASIDLQAKQETRIVGAYTFTELIGQGAFGRVWEAVKTVAAAETARRFAVKEIPLDTVHPETLAGEVNILEQLSHPNIVSYQKDFKLNQHLYIVMEFVEGSTLQELIQSAYMEKKEPLSEELIWRLFVQIVAALRYLHVDKRIIHRDLKPANIMVGNDNQIKLMDFGLASQRQREASLTESVVGTISYCCPEIMHHQPYTFKADIWSLGCMLYQLASGKPPFVADNPLAVAVKIAEGKYTPLDSSRSHLLSTVVQQLLTVNADARPDINRVAVLIAPILLTELDRTVAEKQRIYEELLFEKQEHMRYETLSTRAREQFTRLNTPKKEAGLMSPLRARPGTGGGSMKPPMQRERQDSQPHLTIALDKLRPIDDPLTLMLKQLHKLLFIEHLPPDTSRDPKRRAVMRYARELFSSKDGRYDLKTEMLNLMRASPEVIDVGVGMLHVEQSEAVDASPLLSRSPSAGKFLHRITYDEMQAIIESLLHATGYYDPPASTPAATSTTTATLSALSAGPARRLDMEHM